MAILFFGFYILDPNQNNDSRAFAWCYSSARVTVGFSNLLGLRWHCESQHAPIGPMLNCHWRFHCLFDHWDI
ncbi:hypothetical protein EUGRSUZ_H02677 [Eucalyptus grandis]|uniref:Uncharacterized protein n=2 Tax=Eucalyptus grandis TaxID=71139 RepID=A0ACC3JUN3_EUCGR|nr:hypothetical protein EUGRSUZ_H02677 [Eucalyptus grandis]